MKPDRDRHWHGYHHVLFWVSSNRVKLEHREFWFSSYRLFHHYTCSRKNSSGLERSPVWFESLVPLRRFRSWLLPTREAPEYPCHHIIYPLKAFWAILSPFGPLSKPGRNRIICRDLSFKPQSLYLLSHRSIFLNARISLVTFRNNLWG